MSSRNSSFLRKSGGKRMSGMSVSQWGRTQLSSGGSRGFSGNGVRWEEPGSSTMEQGVHKLCISQLTPHQADTCVVGIVVAKHSIHSFPDKKNPGCQRFKFSFTLRDSPTDYISITCWGSDMGYISRLHSTFRICDIVEITNGQILSKAGGELEDKWNAWTPSPYVINISENYSKLSLYGGPNQAELSCLAHIPLRPVSECIPLSSILSQEEMDGSHVSLLAAVRHVGKPKEMTSKNGKPLVKCEVILMDQDCSSFVLLMWEKEVIELAQTWTAKENIILVVDVKITRDTYRKCMTASCDSKTLIITNPDCREAHQLFQFSQSIDISEDCFEKKQDDSPDNISRISEVFTVKKLKEKQENSSSFLTSTNSGSFLNQFTGILYSYLTCLDIESTNTICNRCECKFRIPEGATMCRNQNCPSLNRSQGSSLSALEQGLSAEPDFNLFIGLSDCTGGIEGVRLMGQAASEVLGITPSEFLNISEEEKISIKSQLLLERFKVYFKSGHFQVDQKKCNVRILKMLPAEMKELNERLKLT